MGDIAEFLLAQYDKDAEKARQATPGPWTYNPRKMWLDGEAFENFDQSKGEEFVGYGGPSPFRGCVAATGPAGHAQSMADAAHIARHDPASVLADIESKRAIVAEYQKEAKVMEQGHRTGWTEGGQAARETALRLLARPFAARDGYNPDWAVQ